MEIELNQILRSNLLFQIRNFERILVNSSELTLPPSMRGSTARGNAEMPGNLNPNHFGNKF